jgi:type IV secretion system protein VirD4
VRETTVSACATQLYIRIDNLDTSEYLSKMLGETTIELKRASLRCGGILGSKTINTDYDAIPLRTPQQLRQMDPRKIILLVSSAPPFELERVIYHDDRPYRQALEQVRFKSVNVPELEPYADSVSGSEVLNRPVLVAETPAQIPVASASMAPMMPPISGSSLDNKAIENGTLSPAVLDKLTNEGWKLPIQDRTIAAESTLPSAPLSSIASIPIEAALAAQIDAGAAAFRKVMEGLPDDGEHRDLVERLHQMVTLHEAFGDDEIPSAEA